MSSQVALIFGYGPRVGVDVAQAFQERGYRVAVVSSSNKQEETASKYLHLEEDLSNPKTVEEIFARVVKELSHPSVVIYNGKSPMPMEKKKKKKNDRSYISCYKASAITMNPASNIDQQIAAFQSDNNINIVSAYIASRLAIESFASLPPGSSPGTFIYTGNKLPFMVVQPLLSQGVGKAGAAHLIHYLAEEYKDSSYK